MNNSRNNGHYAPPKIVGIMTDMTNPQIGESIYDPVCDSVSFLTNCYLHLCEQFKNDNKQLRALKNWVFYGRNMSEMSPTLISPDIYCNNNAKNKFDVILHNPPFSDGKKIRDETLNPDDDLFLKHCADVIAENGRMAIIVPEGFLFRKNLLEARKVLLKNFKIKCIISLPKGVFDNASVKTCIIIAGAKAETEKQSDYYWYYDVKNLRDMPALSYNHDEAIMKYIGFKKEYYSPTESSGYLLKNVSSNVINDELPQYPIYKFKNFMQIQSGKYFHQSELSNSGYKTIHINDITKKKKIKNEYADPRNLEKYIISNGDLLMYFSGAYGICVWEQGNALMSRHLNKIILNTDIILKDYFYILKEQIIEHMKNVANGTTVPFISKENIYDMQIHIPPISEQKYLLKKSNVNTAF